jgi:hypothetical protein
MAICKVVANDCLAPAGYATSLGYYDNGRGPRLPRCAVCGEPVCTKCSIPVGRSRICASCMETEASRILRT